MLAHAQNVVFLAQSQPDTLVVAWATAKSYEGRYLRYLARAEGKDIQPALDCLHESVRIGQKQPGLHMVTLLRSLANALSSPGRQPEFERTLAEIEQLEQRYGKNIAYPEPLRAGLARACKNPREAVRQLETFISKMANDSLVDEQVLDAALVSLSDHYKARRDYQRAYHCLGMVLTHDSPLYRKPISEEQLLNPNIYGPSPFPFFTLNKIGQVFLQQANGKRQSGYLKKALRAFYLSDSLMFAHNDAYNENIILNFQKEVGATLYGDMLEVLCRLDSLEPRNARYRNMALHFMDRMKSDVLFRYLPQNADSEQLRRTKARADSLLAQKNRLTPEGCRQLSMDLYRMEKVKFGNRLGQPVSQRSADAHAAIGPDQAVLHYGIYGAKVFGLCMNNGEVLLRRLPVHGDALAKAVDSIGQNLRTPNGDAAVLGDKAHTLYKLLIGPFEGVLQGRQDWLVVPDKCLFKLPFEVLKPEGADGAYLLERQGLALQYSTAWKIWAAGQASKAQDERSGDALFCNYGGRREGLVCSERERQALDKKADKLECLEGERCTKANFTRCWRSKPYGIVHLSLHGFADPVDAFNNKIWFGQGRRDSLLGFEIGALSGKVDLLVLSVCETYKGEAIASEGIYSIGRSFLQAGAKSLLSALWELDNCPNALLIEHFYAQMNQSPKAKALGQAKRLYLKDPNTPPRLKHPYYWAGLVMVS
jgi:CHAT domain-containing protein